MMKRAIGLAVDMGLVKPVSGTKAQKSQSAKTKSPARKRKSLVKRDIVYKNVKRRGQM